MSDSQPNEAQPKSEQNPPRGRKACKECGVINGVRAYVCKHCGEEFKMKKHRKRSHKIPVENFRDLKEGDLIRVVGGSGPYHTSEDGERTYFIDRGKYTVVKIEKDGIQARGNAGMCYLYMGESCPSKLLDTITNSPCKLQKVYLPNHLY